MALSKTIIDEVKNEDNHDKKLMIIVNEFNSYREYNSLEIADEHDFLADFFIEVADFSAAITALLKYSNYNLKTPTDTSSRGDFVSQTLMFFNVLKSEVEKNISNSLVRSSSEKYETLFGTGFQIEFDDADLERVQELINELRNQISSSTLFQNDHQTRLLARLEKLQSELHKRVSDVDRLWGLVGDAGITLGKFGKDAKPFVDCIKEISEIVWRSQARAEGLPSSAEFPQLGHDHSSEDSSD